MLLKIHQMHDLYKQVHTHKYAYYIELNILAVKIQRVFLIRPNILKVFSINILLKNYQFNFFL